MDLLALSLPPDIPPGTAVVTAVMTAVTTAVMTAVATAVPTAGPAPVTALIKHPKTLPTGVLHLICQILLFRNGPIFFQKRNGTDLGTLVAIC